MNGYKLFRKDRNSRGGGLIFYINESIVSKKLSFVNVPIEIESLFVELNFRNQKWLLGGIYKPPSFSETDFIKTLNHSLNFYCQQYEKIVILGDFNMTIENENLDSLI